MSRPSNIESSLFLITCAVVISARMDSASVLAAGETRMDSVKRLCRAYVRGFAHPHTELCYHHRLNGPRGLNVLSSPADIARRVVNGKSLPWGYGSGIQDVALENGQFLFALCEAYATTQDAELAEMARRAFRGLKRVATVSPVPGFIARGPHPDGKSYYPDSSRDQVCAFVESMWRFHHSELSTDEDRTFIAQELDQVARRMEKYDFVLMTEDGSHMAHVGFGWRQFTFFGAVTLLSHLAAVADVTGDEHWLNTYHRMSAERDGIRWRLLAPEASDSWQPDTLYSNQFAYSLLVLQRTEKDPQRVAAVRNTLRARARRALNSNVFDEQCWRRLDWAGGLSEKETEAVLEPFGLTLVQPATVFDLHQRFRTELLRSGPWRQRQVNGKLLMGLPSVAFHKALLSGDAALIAQVEPCVDEMVARMLLHGDAYVRGENFNRAVVLGLHLLATGAGRD